MKYSLKYKHDFNDYFLFLYTYKNQAKCFSMTVIQFRIDLECV